MWRRAATLPVGTNQHTMPKQDADNISTLKPKRGTSRAYTLERLQRERPDLRRLQRRVRK
jgi:hypothetical protein